MTKKIKVWMGIGFVGCDRTLEVDVSDCSGEIECIEGAVKDEVGNYLEYGWEPIDA